MRWSKGNGHVSNPWDQQQWDQQQWNLRIKDTLGTSHFVLCGEVVLSQRLRKSDPQNNSTVQQ